MKQREQNQRRLERHIVRDCARLESNPDETGSFSGRTILINHDLMEVEAMNNEYFRTKVLKYHGKGTGLRLLRVGDIVVEVDCSEVAPCTFPVWASSPILVEIPPSGVKNYKTGLSSEDSIQKDRERALPLAIKFPVYTHQTDSTLSAFENIPESADSGNNGIDLREPVLAVAITTSGLAEGNKRVERHCVLPVWNDGTTVPMTLDWYEGEPAEGTPNPEWHLSAPKGMPLTLGLQSLQKSAQLPAGVDGSGYRLFISPWKIGATVLDNAGQETSHKIWQREWSFTDFAEFQRALGRICDVLLGYNIELPSVAEQRA